MPRGTRACLLGWIVGLGLVGCTPPLERSRDAALHYFSSEVAAPEPSWSYLLPYLARRYDLEIVLAGDPVGDAVLPVYRRLLDPGAGTTREEIRALESPIDRLLATALHCDRLGLPEDWIDTLREVSDHGGYALTHAVLAAGWTQENGCRSAVDLGPLRSHQLTALEQLIDGREALVRDPRASDIWIEGLALFAHAGASARVRPEWLDALVALQRADGGFPEHPNAERSSAHTTILAVWALTEALAPASGHVPMIPR